MKRYFKMVFTALYIFFIISIIIYCDSKVVRAEDENSVFSLDVDGYWKPSDIKSHDFVVRNGIGEKCYIDKFSFSQVLINDISSGESYSLEEAEKQGIIYAYDVVFSLNDQKYGNEVLYNGKLKDLIDCDIKLPKPLYMDIGQEIKFNISISMDSNAGNEYQNKHYQIYIVPEYYKVIYGVDDSDISDSIDENDNEDFVHDYQTDQEQKDDYLYDGYVDENGNYRVDGYYDKDGKWHNGYYYDKDGIRHEENHFSDGLNRVNKYFKTGQGLIAIIGYEMMFIICCFFIMFRIRQRQNVF